MAPRSGASPASSSTGQSGTWTRAGSLGLPVFGRAGVQVTARTRIIEESCNEPIEMCGVWVKPGDLVIADSSGVVFISADHAEEIVAAAEDIAAREALMTKDVLAGTPISQVMGANYETMLERK